MEHPCVARAEADATEDVAWSDWLWDWATDRGLDFEALTDAELREAEAEYHELGEGD